MRAAGRQERSRPEAGLHLPTPRFHHFICISTSLSVISDPETMGRVEVGEEGKWTKKVEVFWVKGHLFKRRLQKQDFKMHMSVGPSPLPELSASTRWASNEASS